MVRIHHLAWVDNLDAGAIVLVQRHEDWVVAAADSSKYPPADKQDGSFKNQSWLLYDGSGAPECFAGRRLQGRKRQYGRSNRIIQAQGVMQVV